MSQSFAIGIMVLSTICAAHGQLALKLGSMKLDKSITAVMRNHALLAGLFFYGLGTVLSVVALRGHELSVLYPIASLNYVWVSLLSMKYLNEKMNGFKWAGISCILIGTIFIV